MNHREDEFHLASSLMKLSSLPVDWIRNTLLHFQNASARRDSRFYNCAMNSRDPKGFFFVSPFREIRIYDR